MICNKCEYDWLPRVASPKACPRCKVRFDYNIWRNVENSETENAEPDNNIEEGELNG